MESKVNVLTPNGRRQIVKITPNTTLLKILEEACQKHGFNSEDYTLRHHNKEVSLSQTFRFSGLPNNCQLEMWEVDKKRVYSTVDICLQLEDGSRNQAQFATGNNLWEIVSQLGGDAAKSYESPVIIYMRQEIMGKEAMSRTTLKLLGILEGRALLRLANKRPEELKTQAMVYTPRSTESEPKKDGEEKPKAAKTQNEGGGGGFSVTKDLLKSLKKPEPVDEKNDANEPSSSSNNSADVAPQPPPQKVKYDWGSAPGRTMAETAAIDENVLDNGSDVVEEPEYHIIGDRSALIYSLDEAQSSVEDLPDSFYDLTVHDLKIVLRDLRQVVVGNADAPLLTDKLRDIENNNTMLRKIAQYKNCVIRIQFPDRYVLQGMFKPIDKIIDVIKFVQGFLINPEQPCYLFTIPPKTRLEMGKTLLELDFVPNALIHFSLEDEAGHTNGLVKEEFRKKLTSPHAALFAASKFRKHTQRESKTNAGSPMSASTGAIPKRPRNNDASS